MTIPIGSQKHEEVLKTQTFGTFNSTTHSSTVRMKTAGTFTDANPGKHPGSQVSFAVDLNEQEHSLLFLLLVLLSRKLGKPLAGQRKSVMNDNEGD